MPAAILRQSANKETLRLALTAALIAGLKQVGSIWGVGGATLVCVLCVEGGGGGKGGTGDNAFGPLP